MGFDYLSSAAKEHDDHVVQVASFLFNRRKASLAFGLAVLIFLLTIFCRFATFVAYRNVEFWLSRPVFSTPQNRFASTLQPALSQRNASIVVSNASIAIPDGPRPVAKKVPTDAANLRRKELNSSHGVIGERQRFLPVGSGAYLFIKMSAYRGGPRYFSVVGLGSKPAHVYANASFRCEWISALNHRRIAGKAGKMLPDWGYGRIYTVVVVSCSFRVEVGTAGEGGDLILYASPGVSFKKNTARIVALSESPGDYNSTIFKPPYPFDYVYCGSSLFGDISPQRVREWVAYHINFFGPRSHFFLYDAGGIHPGVEKILWPWIDAGRITIQNVRDQEQFDGYYHNQFLIVNDCFHRTRFLSNWTFFFDLDEFLYMPQNTSLQSVLAQYSRFTQIFIEQRPMSSHLCLNDTKVNHSELWGFEKLVFNSVQKGVRRDRKYAIQPRYVYATGVHLTENLLGRSTTVRGDKLRYYHYHGSLSFRGEVCREFVDLPNGTDQIVHFQKEPFQADYSMKPLGASVRLFELEQVGEQPFLL